MAAAVAVVVGDSAFDRTAAAGSTLAGTTVAAGAVVVAAVAAAVAVDAAAVGDGCDGVGILVDTGDGVGRAGSGRTGPGTAGRGACYSQSHRSQRTVERRLQRQPRPQTSSSSVCYACAGRHRVASGHACSAVVAAVRMTVAVAVADAAAVDDDDDVGAGARTPCGVLPVAPILRRRSRESRPDTRAGRRTDSRRSPRLWVARSTRAVKTCRSRWTRTPDGSWAIGR